MQKKLKLWFSSLLLLINSFSLIAEDAPLSVFDRPSSATASAPLIPSPPSLNATGYILQEIYSGQVLVEKNADERMPPASLTKLMSLYVYFEELKQGRIKLDDMVTVSEKAWRTGGSRMFIRHNEKVSVENLLRGIIIVSGNDATVALAEHVAGSEEAFVDLMNQQAQLLGMTNSHFADASGLPHPDQYSTPRDMAILAAALIKRFPEYYDTFAEKSFEYNDIPQYNRNRLLWRDMNVDGLKTGHTKAAGYCLVASGTKNQMRLVSSLFGAPDDSTRTTESQKLLTYGFRFFETHKLYDANNVISQQPIWLGQDNFVQLGTPHDVYITIPTGQYQNLSLVIDVPQFLEAPITENQVIGNLRIGLGDEELLERELIALDSIEKGGFWRRLTGYIHLKFSKIFGSSETT